MAKLHIRHLVGGHGPSNGNGGGIPDEVVYRFEFPERPGALMEFLLKLGERWNISLFHYRNHGAAFGRVLVGLQVPLKDRATLKRYFKELGVSSLKEPAFSAFVFTTFVYRLGLNLPIALYPLYWVNEVGASNAWIGYTTTASYGMLVVAYFLWGRYAPRLGSRRVLLIASIGLSFYPLLTPLVREPIWLIPVALVNGVFAAGIDISFFEGLLAIV